MRAMGRNFMRSDVAQASCLWSRRAARLPISRFQEVQTPGKMAGAPTGGTPVAQKKRPPKEPKDKTPKKTRRKPKNPEILRATNTRKREKGRRKRADLHEP